ncbi:MAG: phosphopyruvate hydratase [Chloroflexi bacterium]|nr:phosphopyruvate hydratase [Chloroflexota bacterium]|tara:strand:+ start:6932 stop:8227 length:1296 start_codon:yes stop_codon:yes gene_type:complete
MTTIQNINAREILDSRSYPTVEVEITLSNGMKSLGSVPSGASTGSNEATELRDNNKKRYNGLGVTKAINNIIKIISPELIGRSIFDQKEIDFAMINLDGTKQKSHLGANAILGVSIAVLKGAAMASNKAIYTYINELNKSRKLSLPVPMLNVINGGKHAENSNDFQEFMIIPIGFENFRESIRAGAEVYQEIKSVLSIKNKTTNIGDEGGYAPSLKTNEEAIELLVDAITKAGYIPGKEIFIGLDIASNELYKDNKYNLISENKSLAANDLIQMYNSLVNKYPIISLEDGIYESDWANWQNLTSSIGENVQIVGDDLYVTNTDRIKKGIQLKASNAVLIKLNQIGTVTETIEAIKESQNAHWGTIISHRSGETEDTIIADIAVGMNAGQIKCGAPARGERTAKYNRLLRIEEELGNKSIFLGKNIFYNFLN